MRIVVDTNIFVSAAIKQGSLRPYAASLVKPETREWVAQLMASAELVTISDRRHVLELATNGHADLILTGDKDLLVLNPFRGIPIVTPAAFVPGATRGA